MRILTYFDKDSWNQHHRNWSGSNGSEVFAFCSPDLEDDCKREADRIFDSVYYCDVRFDKLCNFFLSNVLKEREDYLLVSPENRSPFNATTNKDFFCKVKSCSNLDASVIQVTDCILNLHHRVELIRLLESKGLILDSSFLLGSSDFWTAFIGFQNYLNYVEYLNNSFTSNYADLVLNLFCHSSSSFSLEVEKT